MRTLSLAVMGLLFTTGATSAAELRMQWQTLGPDNREQGTAPGALLVIDIYFQMNAGDSLSAMAFSTEYVPSISQVGTAANNGWLDESTDDVLGGTNQRVVFSGPTLVGPGEFHLGSQTIRLDDVGDGSAKAIMFGYVPNLLDGAGNPYFFSPFPTTTIGGYSIGAGFFGMFCDPISCPPDPLIVNIVHPVPDCNGNFVADSVDITGGGSLDGNGNGRPDECDASVLFVDEHATGLNDGTSWVHAYTNLRDAFDVAHGTSNALNEIWVAAGTYSPGTSRVAAFRLNSGLAVYGGFVGGETDRAERDPLTNSTILTGDVAGNDGPGLTNNDENNFHVGIAIETDPTGVLDGFIITAGHANGLDYPYDRGGGLFILDSSPSVANCAFTRNVAVQGGGVYSAWGWNWPWQPAASLLNCRFHGNVAEDGAGLYNRTSPTNLTNSLFTGNIASERGGAVYNWPGSHATFMNCTFHANVAGEDGGGMYSWGNTRPDVTNCILWNNLPQEIFDERDIMTITYCDVEGGWPGVGNIDSDPLFVDSDGADNVPGTADDDVRPQLGAPVIDAGGNLAVPSSVTTDIIGNDRFLDGDADGIAVVDMGAYEIPDCNGNGNSDEDDVANGSSLDCNDNGVPDECDIGDSSSDANGNGIPDECELSAPVPVDAGSPNDRLKNRYVSVKPNNPGTLVKLEVTLTASLPHPAEVGMSWWVQAPVVPVPDRPKPLLGPGECVAVLGPFTTAAELDWDAAGCQTLHITGCPIEPTSDYDVRAVFLGTASTALSVPTALRPSGGKWWGDIVGELAAPGVWTAPDGVASFKDVQAALLTLTGGAVVPPGPIPPGTVAHLSWADVGGADTNSVVNIDDVLFLVMAFQGDQYPFGPANADGNCP